MKNIYYTGVDYGDGSIGVRFFESQECIDLLEDHDPEMYRGEGGGHFVLTGVTGGLDIVSMREVLDIIEQEGE